MSDKIKELLAKDSFDINDLTDIVMILRSENGCPWDKVQTHKSIKLTALSRGADSFKSLKVMVLLGHSLILRHSM